jgi:DNA-binding IclR family transcriptional regulator
MTKIGASHSGWLERCCCAKYDKSGGLRALANRANLGNGLASKRRESCCVKGDLSANGAIRPLTDSYRSATFAPLIGVNKPITGTFDWQTSRAEMLGSEMRRPTVALPRGQGEAEFSLTASRALQVLSVFDMNRAEMGVSEIASTLELSRTAVQRLVQTLEMHQFLEQNPRNRKYRIGIQAFRIGNLFALGRQLEVLARPDMEALAAKTTFTVYLSLLRHDTMVMTAAVEGAGPIRYYAQVGQRLPLHSTATGKVALAQLAQDAAASLLERTGMPSVTQNTVTDRQALMADLAEIRARGYSINWEENTPGVGSIAAPILDQTDGLLAVLSIAFATSQVDKRQTAALGAHVGRTAIDITTRARDKTLTAAA